MSDRLFLGLMAAAAAGMIALALVWPQGLGARSPGPFGHPPSDTTPIEKAVQHAAATHPGEVAAAATQLRALADSSPPADAPDLRPTQ
jgi:hypothetical protein